MPTGLIGTEPGLAAAGSAKLHDLLYGIDSIISEPAKEDIEAKLSEIRPLLEVLDSEDDAASLPDLMARDLRR